MNAGLLIGIIKAIYYFSTEVFFDTSEEKHFSEITFNTKKWILVSFLTISTTINILLLMQLHDLTQKAHFINTHKKAILELCGKKCIDYLDSIQKNTNEEFSEPTN